MEYSKYYKQMIDMQKNAFDNSYKAVTTVQSHGEKMMCSFLDQASWMPGESKKAINDWIAAFKKGRDTIKNMVDDNFKNASECFASSESAAAKSA